MREDESAHLRHKANFKGIRLEDETADFDLNAIKYNIERLRDDRRSRVLQVMKEGKFKGFAIGNNDENNRLFGTLKSLKSKNKTTGKISIYYRYPFRAR